MMKSGNDSISPFPAKYKRDEVVRLMLQTLHECGYSNTASVLEQESGFQLENQSVIALRRGILGGDWVQAEVAIRQLQGENDLHLKRLLFLLKRQKFIELLLQNNKKDALVTLRGEITGYENAASDLHELTTWLMMSNLDSIPEVGSAKSLEERRHRLYEQMQEYIPKSQVIPSHRLASLFDQAIQYQIESCVYHNSLKTDISLYSDYHCGREQFPCHTTQILEAHSDEVWYVAFSHDGTRLASASKDNTCIIWSIATCASQFVLRGHEDAISFVAWSPDDSMILSCGNDNNVKLWNSQTGEAIRSFTRHADAVTSCAWLPDGDKFVTSSLDKTIFYWNIDGTLLYRWMGARVTDLEIDHSGTKMIAVCHEKKIRIYDLIQRSEDYIQETHPITSLSLSADSKFALVNVAAEEIHLWNLETKELVRKYAGQKQGRFVIRSCFGGVKENFVVSGSEDCNVYIWHRELSRLVESLSGHSGTVNSVSWNPKDPCIFENILPPQNLDGESHPRSARTQKST